MKVTGLPSDVANAIEWNRVELPFSEDPAVLMIKEVTLHLDEFGQRALERLTTHRKGSAAAAVRTACLYYLAERDSGRPAWHVPRFALEPRLGSTLHVQLDEATWEALAGEARHQSVSVDQLTLHAVFYFLADLDSGRLAGRLEEALEEFE